LAPYKVIGFALAAQTQVKAFYFRRGIALNRVAIGNDVTVRYVDYESAWSALHGQAQPNGLIRVWLRFMFVITTPLLRLSPNFVTLTSGIFAVVLAGIARTPSLYWLVAAGIFALGVFDGVDGVIAVRTNRVTQWGAFLDSLMDRVVDVAIAAMFVIAGAHPIVVLVAGTATLIHEYMRARAASVGYRLIGAVTVAEKPTRMILAVVAFTACAVSKSQTRAFMNISSWVWLVIAAIGLGQLSMAYRKGLRAK
jgi:CDP-diacylglycerol--glycerol-3-phosphate 3-phosphatidyltransferase